MLLIAGAFEFADIYFFAKEWLTNYGIPPNSKILRADQFER